MKQIQENPIFQTAAALLLVAASFFATLFGYWTMQVFPYTQADNWQETDQFSLLLQNWNNQLAGAYTDEARLENDASLSYVERQQLTKELEAFVALLDADRTSFRFQIKSADGQTVLGGNVQEGVTLPQTVAQVHYASFVPGEYMSSALSDSRVTTHYAVSDATFVDQSEGDIPLIIESGVPLDLTGYDSSDPFARLANQYQLGRARFPLWLAGCLSCAALTLAALLYLLWAAGHRAGVDGIVLTWQERVFLEPYLLVTLGAAACSVIGAIAILEWLDGLLLFSYSTTKETTITLACVACAALGTLSTVAIALPLRTVAVRRKAHILRQTTLTCRLFHWLRQVCGAALRALPFLWKVLLGFGLYFFGTLFLWSAHWTEGWAGPLWWMLNLTTLLGLCWWAVCFHRLRQGSQAIAAGNLEHQIDTHHMPQELRRLAEDLNNISIGLAGAVDEKMRSERFKAELITNVSHDLKTPLTSILNYVALLHTTEQTDPKAIAYIEVLERKSQRLKKLTEDLVEASKASTGTLRVDREKISMTQLIDQALGEWAERLEASRLTVVTTLPESETYVYADGRHLWRVMDNLLSNCVKYALEGTRVYLDLSRSKGMVTLSIKNISREPLNLPPERLLERFVRGEESRSTEGSGLGLSIAQNLTELQGGTFALSVDGDLFKATVTLPLAN